MQLQQGPLLPHTRQTVLQAEAQIITLAVWPMYHHPCAVHMARLHHADYCHCWRLHVHMDDEVKQAAHPYAAARSAAAAARLLLCTCAHV
jgi:hypothetical protein